jgi:hypothetical protein
MGPEKSHDGDVYGGDKEKAETNISAFFLIALALRLYYTYIELIWQYFFSKFDQWSRLLLLLHLYIEQGYGQRKSPWFHIRTPYPD